jgi:hypothetical protein
MLLATSRSGPACGVQTIRFGGVRNVTATVSESDEGYRIAVEMFPVRAFDPATNKALNLSKGRAYAAQALGKHLKTGRLTIRGLEVRQIDTGGNTFRMVAVVPRDGVLAGTADSLVALQRHKTPDTTAHPPVQPETLPQTAPRRHEIRLTADATTADFLNRKADYLDTVMRIQEAISEEGCSLESGSPKPDDFYDAIGNVEERAEAAFKALGGQVEEDKLLLSLEQEELRPALRKARAETLDSLKSAVARFDQKQEKTKKEKKK